MKKLLFSLSVLSFIVFDTPIADAQQMMIGARLGANLANQSNDSLPSGASNSINTGILAGVQFDYWFNDMWALSVQAFYDEKGSNEHYSQPVTFEGETTTATGTSNLNLNYIEVPILLKASFGSSNIRPYVFAGPSFGFFLSGNESTNTAATFPGAINTTTSAYQDIADSSINSPDISVVFGAGVSSKLTSGQMLFLDAAYSLGLVNITKTSSGDNTTIKSRDIRIAAGILFPLN
jgi:hypothetical protein